MKVITVRDTPPYGHAPTYQISLTYLERQTSYGPDKLRWEEAEEEEQIRLKQYVCLRSKERHKYTWSWSQATILLYFICKSLSLAFYYVLYFFTTKYKTSSSSQTFFCYGWPQMKRVQSFIYFLYRNSRGLVQLIVWIEQIYFWKWH
jgi:hypothetical protein